MTPRDLVKELQSDLEQIEDNVGLYLAGRDSAYQTVALQLRTLLLDGRRGLLLRVIPDATLHPMREIETSKDRPLEQGTHRSVVWGHADMYMPDDLHPRAELALPLDWAAAPVPVQQWLDDWIVGTTVKIRDLIKSTADEDVAHTQSERGRLLAKLSGTGVSWGQVGAGPIPGALPAQEIYQMAIIAIGQYVAARVRELLTPGGPMIYVPPKPRPMIGTVKVDWVYADDEEESAPLPTGR